MKGFLQAGVAALCAWALPVAAQYADPWLNWRTLQTANFEVHFAEPYRAQAQQVARVAEAVYPKVTQWLSWKPESRTHIVVYDSIDSANGFATPLPFNYMGILLSPPDDGELLQNREWLDLVITHEFVHIVHLDKARSAPLAYRRIFGRSVPWFFLLFPNTFPNALAPAWVPEGLATYAESDKSKRWGRLEQSHFEGQMRAEATRGLVPLREIHAHGRGFPLNRDYLYGSYFFLFLAERYGPKAIQQYVENYSGGRSWIPYRIHSNTVAITKKPQDELWDEFEDWLKARFAVPPDQKFDEGGPIAARSWSIESPLLARDGARWYVQSDGYTLPELVRERKGAAAETVRKVERGTRLAALPGGAVLMAKPEICDNYNYYYDLYRVAPDGDTDRLSECGRFRFAAPLEDGRIAAIRVVNGVAEVVMLAADGKVERSLYRAAPGESLTGVAAKGDKVAVTSLRDDRWSLIEIADGKPQVLAVDAAVKHSPRYGDVGDDIYFVADYGNTANVWSWQRGDRRLARWTAARTGVLEISAPASGEMLLTTIEADGGVLRTHRLPDAPHETLAANAETPSEAAAKGAPPTPQGVESAYSPWSALLPRSWYPTGYVDSGGAFAIGAGTFGQDALGLHYYALEALYEFTEGEPLGTAAYVYNRRHRLLLSRWMTVKATQEDNDGNDEVKTYAINETAQWVSVYRHDRLNARFYAGLGAAFDRETFHDVTAGETTPHDERVIGIVAGLDTRREQWLSEGPSQGFQLRLFAETSNGLGGLYDGNFYRGDLRVHLPLGRTVAALRWNQAYSQKDAEPSQLGGTFDDPGLTLPLLNQREFPLRGYTSGHPQLTGRNTSLGSLEWRIPIADVDRHTMVPPIGVNRVSITVFGETGSAWSSGQSQRWYSSAGLELILEPRFGYLFGAQVRIGVAQGFDSQIGETVVYARAGRQF